MKIKLNRVGEPFLLEAESESGSKIVFDASEHIGGTNKGVRPTEALASSLAACSSIDVLLILGKQKLVPESYEVEIDASRVDAVPSVIDKIHLTFKLKGVPLDKAERAINLSLDKYCTVSRMLEQAIEITSSIELIK